MPNSVEMHRFTSEQLDDAHELNRLICLNHEKFTDDFVGQWHIAYAAYCMHRIKIVLEQGADA